MSLVIQVEHLSQETMSSNRFGKSHLAFHSFLMERLTLVFFKFNGVFAIAFMTEFCFSGWNGKNSVHFDTNVMRNHLLKCMEDKQFSPFPKIKPVKSKFTLTSTAP
jgi:hypothetical protein